MEVFFFLPIYVLAKMFICHFPKVCRNYFVTRKGIIFSLLENETNDTLVFEVTNYENKFEKDKYNFLSIYNDQYHQILLTEFGSDENIHGGIMYADGSCDSPSITISLVSNQSILFEEKLVDTLVNYPFNNKTYPELYVFAKERGKSPRLYFTKEDGIIYIDSTASGNS